MTGHPEANLQTQLVKWARECVIPPHKFKAFDRSKNENNRHMYEARRGVQKGTLDTCLILQGGRHIWIELKAHGVKLDPKKNEAQAEEIADLVALDVAATWVNSIAAYARYLQSLGVPLRPLAFVRAEDLDLLCIGREMTRKGSAPRSYKPRSSKARSKSLTERERKAAAVHARVGMRF
jgi:hypothetical protein